MLIKAKIFFTVQQLKVKNLSPNRHTWYSPVTQFVLPLKMKLSRKDTSYHEAFFTHKPNFEQASLKH